MGDGRIPAERLAVVLSEMCIFDPDDRDFYTRVVNGADDEMALVRRELREAREGNSWQSVSGRRTPRKSF